MQIKLIFITKVSHFDSFCTGRDTRELGNGLSREGRYQFFQLFVLFYQIAFSLHQKFKHVKFLDHTGAHRLDDGQLAPHTFNSVSEIQSLAQTYSNLVTSR